MKKSTLLRATPYFGLRQKIRIGLFLLLCFLRLFATAQPVKPLSITMDEYAYPYEVRMLPLTIEDQDLRMAYMDVSPNGPANGKTVVLMHGKNFFGAYWKETIQALATKGFRVIVPDQLGFGKSSKPDLHYSFHLLASNTRQLLDTLGVKQCAVIGHSMGGMLATRFTLMYPEMVTQLVLENPIGLEDYRPLVPYSPLDAAYKTELNNTEAGIRKYQQAYYVQWKPEYEEYVQVQIRWKASGEFPRLALSSAETYQMIYEQPVCYEFPLIKAKTLLIIGQSDRTVVGKTRLKKEFQSTAGQYPELGRKTAKQIPGATLVELKNVGHIPHFEAREQFHQEVLNFLR